MRLDRQGTGRNLRTICRHAAQQNVLREDTGTGKIAGLFASQVKELKAVASRQCRVSKKLTGQTDGKVECSV